jgi:ATP-dependent Lhr-like helicase
MTDDPRPAPRPRAAFDATLAAWFAAQGWTPLSFQRRLWRHYLAGDSGLLHTPTGSGKTLAAFGGPLLEALRGREREARRERVRQGRLLARPAERTAAGGGAVPARAPARKAARKAGPKPERRLQVLWITPH